VVPCDPASRACNIDQAIEDAFVIVQELEGCKTRDAVSGALQRYRERRLVRSAAVQGLSRFASDIIIRGFDTPAKIVRDEDGSIKFENFNYAGIVTKILQPILPVFFFIQFAFLYEGWKNEFAFDAKAALGFTIVGGLILILAAGSVEAGIIIAPLIEGVFGAEGILALGTGAGEGIAGETGLQNIVDWFSAFF